MQALAVSLSKDEEEIRLARRAALVKSWAVVTHTFTNYRLHVHRYVLAMFVYAGVWPVDSTELSSGKPTNEFAEGTSSNEVPGCLLIAS